MNGRMAGPDAIQRGEVRIFRALLTPVAFE
jgi:hypothetical protein